MNVKWTVFFVPATPQKGNYFHPSEPVPRGQEKLSDFKYFPGHKQCDEQRRI